jgi:hypothetical protein
LTFCITLLTTRKEEIIILLQHLRDDVIKTAKNYPSLLSKKIVENGKLIEKYELEFDELKEKGL